METTGPTLLDMAFLPCLCGRCCNHPAADQPQTGTRISLELLGGPLFLEVLEHLMEDGPGLNEICPILRPGGNLVLSVPPPPGEVNEDSQWGHKREGYELSEILNLLATNNLKWKSTHSRSSDFRVAPRGRFDGGGKRRDCLRLFSFRRSHIWITSLTRAR